MIGYVDKKTNYISSLMVCMLVRGQFRKMVTSTQGPGMQKPC